MICFLRHGSVNLISTRQQPIDKETHYYWTLIYQQCTASSHRKITRTNIYLSHWRHWSTQMYIGLANKLSQTMTYLPGATLNLHIKTNRYIQQNKWILAPADWDKNPRLMSQWSFCLFVRRILTMFTSITEKGYHRQRYHNRQWFKRIVRTGRTPSVDTSAP